MKKTMQLSLGGSTAIASSIKLPGSNEYLVGANGELNANNKAELVQAIASLMEVASTTKLVTEGQALSLETAAATHREMIQSAFDSKEELAALGDLIADNLTQTINREGFARRMMRFQELVNGQIPQAKMTVKKVIASIAIGPVQQQTQFIREDVIFPPEFYITARPYIEMKEIQRSANDILEDKYVESLEAIMVQEDRTWKRQVDALIGIDNPHLNIAGNFTPAAFAELVGYVSDWGVSPGSVLFASDIWQDMITGNWKDVLDPVSQHEVLLTGRLATVHGVNLMSDNFRVPNLRVLNQGEIYVVGSPDQHGQMTDRGGVDSSPLDIAHERVPGRGWAMSETISMVIANSRSVARGRRTR